MVFFNYIELFAGYYSEGAGVFASIRSAVGFVVPFVGGGTGIFGEAAGVF